MKYSPAALAALALGCGPALMPLPWADTAATMRRIECSVAARDGQAVADLVMDVVVVALPGYPLAGLYQPPRLITLRAEAPSAMASALRHEIAHHWLRVTTGNAHTSHGPAFEARYRALNEGIAACAD